MSRHWQKYRSIYYLILRCSIDQVTHVIGPVALSSVENEYNAACTAGMTLAHFSMSIHELLNKNPDIVPEEAHLII